MIFSSLVCLAAFWVLLSLLRRDQVSLGLPIAYLFQLLLIHVPGAFAHIVGGELLADSHLTAIGIRLSAIGSVSYLGGVWLARSSVRKSPINRAVDRHRFCLFCLVGGWGVTYGLGPLRHFASLGAAIEQGGFIWMLGVLLGLREALQRRNFKLAGIWLSALVVYPILMLLLGGFMSWGSMTVIIVLSALTISTRSYRRVAIGIAIASWIFLAIFVNYFQHRTEIRTQVWGGGSLEARVESVVNAFTHFEWLDPANPLHLGALDQRLNQNYFVGLAADRLQRGEVDYLDGSTILDGVMALIPRALWPEKSVSVGSGRIVASMTGLPLPETTSFGVGSVMEFYINFGITGLVIGFLLLGWITGTLDLKAALAEREGALGSLILYFLPAEALMSPIGSLVDLSSAYAAGLLAAFAWREVWKHWSKPRNTATGSPAKRAQPYENLAYRS